MFRFLFGVAFGAAGYWAWQSFGRDLLGMGSDQDTTYGGFNSGTTGTSFGSTNSTPSAGFGTSSTTPSSGSSPTTTGGTGPSAGA
jgi:hypothetical protein